MNKKHLAMLSPLCLALLAATAGAAESDDGGPFSVGLSETLTHDSNIGHNDDAHRKADWFSTTELNAAIREQLGRDTLNVTAAVDLNRYKNSHPLNSVGYQAAAEFDFNTIGDLSGSLGADTHRRQYVAGQTLDLGPDGQTETIVHNLQTDSHAFARLVLGAESRFAVYGGADANQRHFSNDLFRANDERQWSTNLGTRYSTSPDLSFSLNGTYVRGEYPHGGVIVNGQAEDGASHFSTRSYGLSSHWQASGNSAVDASAGYTTEDNQELTGKRNFVNGSLNWKWTPPSHFTVNFGIKRSSDADASTSLASVGTVNGNNLNGTSINNVGHLELTYALTAKVSLDASEDYTDRKYTGLRETDTTSASGTTKTSRLYFSAHYIPSRTTDVNCGVGHETRHGSVVVDNVDLTPAYGDTFVQCAASIRFD